MTQHLITRLAILLTLLSAAAVPARAQALPGAPGTPVVTTGLGAITVVWPAPAAGGAPTGYRLEFYNASPRTLLGAFLTGTDRVFSAAVANGTYSVRVAAVNAAGTGPDSLETTFVVGPTGLAPPHTPIDLRTVVVGQQVTLSWNMTAASPRASSFWIELGTAAGISNLGVFDTASSALNITRQMLPGLYFARVRATNAAGVSAASQDVSFLVTAGASCTQAPFAPNALSATVSGTSVSLAWTAAPSGSAATSHLVEAGSAPGLADIASFSTGVPSTVLTTTATSGIYFVRVRASNACGLGLPSNEVIVTVP